MVVFGRRGTCARGMRRGRIRCVLIRMAGPSMCCGARVWGRDRAALAQLAPPPPCRDLDELKPWGGHARMKKKFHGKSSGKVAYENNVREQRSAPQRRGLRREFYTLGCPLPSPSPSLLQATARTRNRAGNQLLVVPGLGGDTATRRARAWKRGEEVPAEKGDPPASSKLTPTPVPAH